MKKVFVICLICLLAFTLVMAAGCSKKEEKAQNTKKMETAKTGMKASLIDPVDKKPVDIKTTPYYYVYKDIEYYFNTEANMKAFREDPDKYLTP
ncbi:MAG TPA: YHS domain-containing protein [Patescibacteria group bacterium]|nr:YHS domain-containing protein [Patescibacteria group bacterium]